MYILQTTTAVLISFLAILAYNKIRSRKNQGRSRSIDLELPGSSKLFLAGDFKPTLDHDGTGDLTMSAQEISTNLELDLHKTLYFKLHSLELYPEILPECRQVLLSLLSETFTDAFGDPEGSILSVPIYSRNGLSDFLQVKDADVTNRWEEYLARRRGGGSREMFSDRKEAEWWLKQAAPVKYVDGSWLGHINKISTPFRHRHITKNAWQVMSEELGDGDLAKNHVHVYRNLMKDIGAELPPADSEDFIHPRHELKEARCWKAALAQMLISLFPHDFLPEALGFNLAYESLPLHLLKTIKELRELRLNPYYFELHISIDNADSGHAAMALAAVTEYIESVEESEGMEAAHVAWKRVQAGYILAEGLPTTPESPSLKSSIAEPFPRNRTETELVNIFAAKSLVAHKIHCNSRLRIGARFLVDWLEPKAFTDAHWQKEFLHDLSNCKPWVVKGHSENSRLVKELSWGGRMFGGFTEAEVDIVKRWIDELGGSSRARHLDASAYVDFSERQGIEAMPNNQDIMTDYPVLVAPPHSTFAEIPTNFLEVEMDNTLSFNLHKVSNTNLLPLWFISVTLLESLPSVPVRAADSFGSAVVRVLRAQNGFDIEGSGVAGMDEVRRTHNGHAIGIIELGIEMCLRTDIAAPRSVREAASLGDADTVAFAQWMVWLSMHWLTHRDMLIGMTWVFMELHDLVAECESDNALLDESSRRVLKAIADRERKGLGICRGEIESVQQRKIDFYKGVAVARRAVESL